MPTAAAAPPPPKEEDGGPFAEGDLPEEDEEERPQAQLHWVYLDAWTGRLLCPSLGIEAACLTGRIIESRLVSVFQDTKGQDIDNQDSDVGSLECMVLCASSNRLVADFGRPGRECASCLDRHGVCSPRWRLIWTEPKGEEEQSNGKWAGTGLFFAHTLSVTGTLHFTRYRLTLRRSRRKVGQVLTRLFVEESRRETKTGEGWLAGASTVHRHLQFQEVDQDMQRASLLHEVRV
jgi:hypothetical protein